MRALSCGLAVVLALLAASSIVAAPAGPKDPVGQINKARLLRAAPQEWLTTGGDFGESHHSPLAAINESNLDRLGLAWEYDARSRRGRVQRGQEATPIVVDGVMYTSGPWGTVYALDARTGRERWRFDPELDGAWARKTCCDAVNRGVAVWQGRVYVGQLDGHLVALDASSGKVLWKRDTLIDRQRGYSLSGAPRIAGDVVVIGNGGAEFGVRGYITAYDLRSGRQRWRFYTTPSDPKLGPQANPALQAALKTWSPQSRWEAGGGGTVWDSMVYDPQLDLLYVGTGNGSPHPAWIRSPGGGDNLYLSSILAIRPRTGQLVWHYQTTPGDSWDYTATQPLVLAELPINGRPRKVLMQAPKNGFFYVLDRATGELLSAEKYVTTTWAEKIDLKTGKPVRSAQADYSQQPKLIYPSALGGHNWMPMAYSRQSGLVYIPVIDYAFMSLNSPQWQYREGVYDYGSAYVPVVVLPPPLQADLSAGQPAPRMQEYLLAWDPVAQREAWRVPNAGTWNGGTLSTDGGLVFQGTASGHLKVYRAKDGQLLKAIDVGTSIMAAPMSYALDGVQYVAVMAGYGGAVLPRLMPGNAAFERDNRGRILAFKLDGGPTPLPALREPEVPNELPAPIDASAAELARGKALYELHCARCHAGGLGGVQSGFPNLFNLHPGIHTAFNAIVLEGVLSQGGMASFKDVLSASDARVLQAYLIDESHRLRSGQAGSGAARMH